MHRFRSALAPPIVLTLLVLLSFAPLVAQPSGLLVDSRRPAVDEFVPWSERSPGNDLTRLFLPLHQRVGGWLRELGRVPGWDPTGFGGRPLVGNPQASLWYPPVWLAWVTGIPAALGWITVAHLAFGAWGAYRLGRDARLAPLAALVAGGSFALAPYTLAQAAEGHLPHVWAASYYPWAFLAQRLWRRGDRRGAAALPLVLSAAFLAGHYQEVGYLLLALLAWSVLDVFRAIAGRHRAGGPSPNSPAGPAMIRLGAWPLLLALAAAITAIEWMPFLALGEWLLEAPGASASEAGKYHWHPSNLLQLLDPAALGGPADYFGRVSYWEVLLSFGWIPLVLAVVATAAARDRGEVRGWAALAVAAIVFAAGPGLGLFTVLYAIVPGMGQFRVPARAMFLASLAVAMLAGLGFQTLVRGDRRLRRWVANRYRRAAVAIAGLVILAAILGSGGGRGRERLEVPGSLDAPVAPLLSEADRCLLGCARLVRSPGFWVPLFALGLALELHRRRPGRVSVGVAAAAALLSLAIGGMSRVVVTPASHWLRPDPIAQAMRDDAPVEPFRVRIRESYYDDLRAVAAGLEATNLQDQFQLRHVAELYRTIYSLPGPVTRREKRFPEVQRRLDRGRRAVLDRMNTTYVVTDSELNRLEWPRVAVPDAPSAWLYRNPAPLPRAHVVPRAAIHSDDASVVERFPSVDPRAAVLMPADPLGGGDGDGGAGPARQPFTPAEYDRRRPDRLTVRVATTAPGLLVIRDAWMPGWSATLDGEAVPILRGDRAWRVVALPRAGRHLIEMAYHPPALPRAAAITAAGLLTWLVFVAVLMVASGTRRREPS